MFHRDDVLVTNLSLDVGTVVSQKLRTVDEALTVFRDPLAVIFEDETHSSAEKREIIIGHSNRNRVLLVCFTERAIEVIRIFSASRATKKEQADYEENPRF